VKKILITGGLGNLGSWLTRYFCEKKWEVSVLGATFRDILPDYNFNFITCDITNLENCKKALDGQLFNFVIHTASFNDTFMPNYAHKSIEINALGTRNILDSLEKTNLKNFIYLSTFHVYGKTTGKITENTPVAPVHDYATTHLFGELYVEQFFRNANLPYTIIRLTNSYGCPIEKSSSKWYLVLNDLAKMAATNKIIELKSNGKPQRDFIWMGDVCSVLENICLLKNAPNGTFNLSGEMNFTMVEIAEKVQNAYFEVYNEKVEIRLNEQDKNDYQQNIYVSSEKLKKISPFKAKDKIEEEAKKIFKKLTNNQ
jgi:UDP-glucose 4-epimerase